MSPPLNAPPSLSIALAFSLYAAADAVHGSVVFKKESEHSKGGSKSYSAASTARPPLVARDLEEEEEDRENLG